MSLDYRDYLDHRPKTPWTERAAAPWKYTAVATFVGIAAGLAVGIAADARDAPSMVIGGIVGSVGFDSFWRYVREANSISKRDK